jgi:transcriptional regulator with XRE-family HTH domain
MAKMSTGEKIKALRKEKKWSQDDLSKAIGVHSKHISRYENNKVTPSPETLRKMADVFDVSTDYLLQDNVPRDEKIKINDPELLRQFELIGQLNEEDQATIKNVIKAMIMKNQMERVISQ